MAARVYLVVGATWLLFAAVGWNPFGFDEPIGRLSGAEVRRLCDAAGVEVSMVTCHPDYTNPDPAERARFSAVVGILGMLLVPFIHLSVYLFRTLHPQPVVLKPSAPSLPRVRCRARRSSRKPPPRSWACSTS